MGSILYNLFTWIIFDTIMYLCVNWKVKDTKRTQLLQLLLAFVLKERVFSLNNHVFFWSFVKRIRVFFKTVHMLITEDLKFLFLYLNHRAGKGLRMAETPPPSCAVTWSLNCDQTTLKKTPTTFDSSIMAVLSFKSIMIPSCCIKIILAIILRIC